MEAAFAEDAIYVEPFSGQPQRHVGRKSAGISHCPICKLSSIEPRQPTPQFKFGGRVTRLRFLEVKAVVSTVM
jgi:hypothetical protein